MVGHNVLHVHISVQHRQLNRVVAVDQPIVPGCEESRLILCDDGCGGLQWLGVAKAALLFAMLGAEAIGGRAAGVALAGGYQVSQVLINVQHVPVWSVADMGINFGRRSIGEVVTIREDSWVYSGNQLVCMADDLFLQSVSSSVL